MNINFDIYRSRKEALAETKAKKVDKREMRRVVKKQKEQDRKVYRQRRLALVEK